MRAHVEDAEQASLAHLVATTPVAPGTDPIDQIPQWLFAFDPAGAATLRGLALLAVHPDAQARMRGEIAASRGGPEELPGLRAVVLESVRLWPTTPVVAAGHHSGHGMDRWSAERRDGAADPDVVPASR